MFFETCAEFIVKQCVFLHDFEIIWSAGDTTSACRAGARGSEDPTATTWGRDKFLCSARCQQENVWGFIQGHLINQIRGILEGTLNQIRDVSNIREPGPKKCAGVCKADALLENTCVGYALYTGMHMKTRMNKPRPEKSLGL